MSWYCITLSAEQLATGVLEKRRDEFEKAFKAARGPRAMALFQKEGQGGGRNLLLTPDCAEYAAVLLEEWGCTPVESPAMAGMSLLVGFNEITYYLY